MPPSMPFGAAAPIWMIWNGGGLFLLTLGAGGLCAASLVASAALGPSSSPGRRALASWTPVAAMALVSLFLGRPEIAIGVVFGTSVALLAVVVGAISLVAPVGPAPVRWRRLWPFTLAAGLMAFLVGFSGFLLWEGALSLVVEGLVVLSLWREPHAEGSHHPSLGGTAGAMPRRPVAPPWVAWAIAMPLAVLAAWGATHGAVSFGQQDGHLSTGTVAATVLSLSLALPMIQDARRFSAMGQSWLPVTSLVGVVLLNLCLLLPLLAFVPYAKAILPAIAPWNLTWPPRFDVAAAQPLVFPYVVWRVDTMALIVLSILLLPVSMGKWNLGREEGMLLVAGYGFYLMVVMVTGAS